MLQQLLLVDVVDMDVLAIAVVTVIKRIAIEIVVFVAITIDCVANGVVSGAAEGGVGGDDVSDSCPYSDGADDDDADNDKYFSVSY